MIAFQNAETNFRSCFDSTGKIGFWARLGNAVRCWRQAERDLAVIERLDERTVRDLGVTRGQLEFGAETAWQRRVRGWF